MSEAEPRTSEVDDGEQSPPLVVNPVITEAGQEEEEMHEMAVADDGVAEPQFLSRNVGSKGITSLRSGVVTFHGAIIEPFALFMIILIPIVVMMQGFALNGYWRWKYLNLEENYPDGPPFAYQYQVAIVFLALVTGNFLCVPMFYWACASQVTRKKRRFMLLKSILCFCFLCGFPMIAGHWLLTNEFASSGEWEREIAHYSQGVVFALSFGSLWFIYLVYVTDYIQGVARKAADDHILAMKRLRTFHPIHRRTTATGEEHYYFSPATAANVMPYDSY